MEKKYAGFWARVVAYIVDYLLFSMLMVVLAFAFMAIWFPFSLVIAGFKSDPVIGFFVLFYSLFSFFARWLYFAVQHSSEKRGTFGMRAMGFRLEGAAGERVSFGRATGRYFAGILSTVIFYIGYFMIGWTKKKQGLHDLLADTYTVYDQVQTPVAIDKEKLPSDAK